MLDTRSDPYQVETALADERLRILESTVTMTKLSQFVEWLRAKCLSILGSLTRRLRGKAAMTQVIRIPVPKEKLQALSKEERVLIFLLGYVTNQITMLEKLVRFSVNHDGPAEIVELQANGIQTQMLLRLMIGVLNEAWNVIVTRFNKSPVNVAYRSLLDPDGQQALANLNKQFGDASTNLITRLRINYSFHHPQSDNVEAAFESACDNPEMDDQWNLYFSQHGYNTLFFMSDIVISHGIFKEIGESEWDAGQQKIMNQVLGAANNIREFARAFTKAVWLKHFGEEMIADKVIEIRDAPNVEHMKLPFYVTIPGERPIQKGVVFR